jgi:hypothetical protein
LKNRIITKGITTILLISIITSCFVLAASFQPAKALTTDSTLADTLNSTINNVDWSIGNSWTSNWAMILANKDYTAFDAAISQDIARGNYVDALYVARLADLNGYSSDTIIADTKTALQQISMCGSLPITANAKSYGDPDLLNTGCFLVYNRYALYGYKYAAQYSDSTSKWDINQAFTDFAAAYTKKPIGSVSGEMLWCDPQENWAKSYSSRYYDEHAETLSSFLQFAEQNVPNALSYADQAWTGVQSHWNSQYGYYGYTGTTVTECEVGNFAQIIAEYMTQKGGTITNWDRVISDINYKLLANSWSSPGWASPGVMIHAKGVNSQLRLWETMGSTIALQNLFPYFTPTMKTNWASMLMGANQAWKGLVASSLNTGGYFSGVSGTGTSNEATVCAAATLFLDGIVPVTGNLAIPYREEFCNDYRTPFSVCDFKFDYTNRQIRIPVNAGQLTFIYGSSPISYTFPTSDIYTIQFSNDWNLITAVNGVPVVTNPPSEPQTLKAIAGNNQVALTWSPPTTDGGAAVTVYKIYKSASEGLETLAFSLGNVLSYTDTAVTNGQTYYYTVTATNAAGESVASIEVSATPTAPIIKSMTVDVQTSKTSYSRGQTVTITVPVSDSGSGAPIKRATVKVAITDPNNRAVWTGSSTTNSNGLSTLNYRLSNSATRGTYSITATVTFAWYSTSVDKTTFAVK